MTPQRTPSQKERLVEYLSHHGLARAFELAHHGVSATAIARAAADGTVIRIARGLYQLAGEEVDAQVALAEVSKQAPKGVICLVSALAYHDLTDQLPRKVWIAIGASDWNPKISYPPIRTVRFREPYFSSGIETHKICGVRVPIYSPAKSIADAFRNPNLVDWSVGIESMKSVLANRKATPAELYEAARKYGAENKVKPYLEALIANG